MGKLLPASRMRPSKEYLRPVHSFSEFARVVVGISIFGIARPLPISCIEYDPVRGTVASDVLLVTPACSQKGNLYLVLFLFILNLHNTMKLG